MCSANREDEESSVLRGRLRGLREGEKVRKEERKEGESVAEGRIKLTKKGFTKMYYTCIIPER